MTPQQIAALEELQRRGVDVSSYQDAQQHQMQQGPSDIDRQSVITELQRRGIDVSNDQPQQPQQVERPGTMYGLPEEASLNRKGFMGILDDIATSAKKTWPGVKQYAKERLGSDITGTGKQLFDMLSHSPDPEKRTRAARNVLTAGGQLGQGIYNAPSTVQRYLGEKFDAPESSKELYPRSEIDFTEIFGVEKEQPGDEFIRGLASFSPFARAAGAMAKGGGLARKLGASTAATTAYGIAEEADPVQMLLTEGALRGVSGVAKGVKKASDKVSKYATPSKAIANIYGKNIPLAELNKRMGATEGTATQLGEVIESPSLKKTFENWASQVPMSGVEGSLQKMAEQVVNKATTTLKDLTEISGKKIDPNYYIEQKLKGAFKAAEKEKQKTYKPVDKLIDKEGIVFDMPTFKSVAKQSLNELENSPLLKSEPLLSTALKRLAKTKVQRTKIDESSRLDKQGKPIKTKTIQSATLPQLQNYAQALTRAAERDIKSPSGIDRGNAKLYERAAKAIRKDIKDTIQKKGSKELQEVYNSAQKNYAENYAPFLEGDIYKLIHSSKDAQDLIRRIVKPGKKYDKFKNIEKIQKFLPEKDKNVMGFGILSDAIDEAGVVKPHDILKEYNALGKRQKSVLFPDPSTRKALEDLKVLTKLNSEALNLMFNPKTGARGLSSQVKVLMGLVAGTTASIGGAAGLLASIKLATGIVGASRAFNRLMTSEKFRNKVADEIIKNREKYKNKKPADISIPDDIMRIVSSVIVEETE